MTAKVCIFECTEGESSPDTSPVSNIDFKRGIRYEITTYYFICHGINCSKCRICRSGN